MSTHSHEHKLTPTQKKTEKERLVGVIEYQYRSDISALTSLNPRRQNLSNTIITECVRVIVDRDYASERLTRVHRLIQSFIYYINQYESQLKENIVNEELDSIQGPPAGIHDTLNALCDGLDKEEIPADGPVKPVGPIVRNLVHANRLPTQTGGQKIRKYRKYRKTRTKSSKSNIRTRRHHRRCRCRCRCRHA